MLHRELGNVVTVRKGGEVGAGAVFLGPGEGDREAGAGNPPETSREPRGKTSWRRNQPLLGTESSWKEGSSWRTGQERKWEEGLDNGDQRICTVSAGSRAEAKHWGWAGEGVFWLKAAEMERLTRDWNTGERNEVAGSKPVLEITSGWFHQSQVQLGCYCCLKVGLVPHLPIQIGATDGAMLRLSPNPWCLFGLWPRSPSPWVQLCGVSHLLPRHEGRNAQGRRRWRIYRTSGVKTDGGFEQSPAHGSCVTPCVGAAVGSWWMLKWNAALHSHPWVSPVSIAHTVKGRLHVKKCSRNAPVLGMATGPIRYL